MPQIAQLIGGAGTGKTTELLRLMDGVVERLHDPHLIGFCSFTRAARREASNRAADRFNLKPAELEAAGWFRTLHSICYRCLGVGKEELITDTKSDREWIQDALQESVNGKPTGLDQDLSDLFGGTETDAGKALAIWDAARNRLQPYDDTWHAIDDCSDHVPDLTFCRQIVERYEQAKRLDHRVDFTDLLAKFAGQYCDLDGAEKCAPEGEAPNLPVWFLDEVQDSSALLHECELRLISQPSVQWVYTAGDPFQSIYGFAGADPQCFLSGFGPTTKRRIMPRSYRCPAPILELGESLLHDCSDYFDREIQPADHAGSIESEPLDRLIDLIDPRNPWLLLARTNFLAGRLARRLDDADMPWLPTRGNGSWNAPVRSEAIAAIMNLEVGAPIDGREWQSILKFIPAKLPDGALLAHGTKSCFSAMTTEEAQTQHAWMYVADLGEVGATQLLIDGVKAGVWRSWIEGADRYTAAADRWGQEAIDEPKIRVGTIHSVKGSEADNVAVLTSISAPCFRAAQSQEGFNEETRCKYVAVTRAKRRLVVLNETKTKYRWRFEL